MWRTKERSIYVFRNVSSAVHKWLTNEEEEYAVDRRLDRVLSNEPWKDFNSYYANPIPDD